MRDAVIGDRQPEIARETHRPEFARSEPRPCPLAADAGAGGVGASVPRNVRQGCRHALEALVPGRVPKRVVEQLEMVDIDHHRGHGLPFR